MKVLILSFYYEPDLSACSFRTTALVKQLSQLVGRKGIVDVLTTMPNRYEDFHQSAERKEHKGNVNVTRIKIPAHKSGMLDQVKAYIAFYRKATSLVSKADNYDIVYATSSRLFTAFLGARISAKLNRPLYLDIRDIFLDTLDNILNKKLLFVLKPFLKIVERYTFNKATHINLVSQGFDEYSLDHYPNKKYSYYTNGIDSAFISVDKSKEILNDKEKVILYAGNIGEGQGLHNILPELAKLLPSGFKIKVIGGGGRKAELLDRISQDGINNIQVFDPIERQKLIQEYRASTILFLHLNDYDAFKKVLPSKIFEYAAVGKPILAGVSGYARKFLERVENSAVFDPCNERQAIMALNTLTLNDKDRETFVAKYSREKIMSDMAVEILSYVPKAKE